MRTSGSLTLNGVLTAVWEAANNFIVAHVRDGYDPARSAAVLKRLGEAINASRGLTVGPALDTYVDEFHPDETLIALRAAGCSWSESSLSSIQMTRWRTLHDRLASMTELSFELNSHEVTIPEQALGSLRDLYSSFSERVFAILEPVEHSLDRGTLLGFQRNASRLIDPFYNLILVNGKLDFASEQVVQVLQNIDEAMKLLAVALSKLRDFEYEATGTVNVELAEAFEASFVASIERDLAVLKRTSKQYLTLMDHEELVVRAYAYIGLDFFVGDEQIIADELFAETLRTRTAYFNQPTHERFEVAVDALSLKTLADRAAVLSLSAKRDRFEENLFKAAEEHYDRLIAAVLLEEIAA